MGGLLYGYRENKWPLLMLPVFLFVRMGLNALDGMLAREHHMESKLGVMLNEIGDVCSDTVVYLPLASMHQMPPAPIVLIVVLSVVSEMTGVIALQIGGLRRYDGPMGKSDRAFAIGLIALLVGLNAIPETCTTAALWAVVLLLFLTIGNRGQRALRGT
jgi:CDP-diacylglycerol--glycerol-3-phosphate 3-phosphatidyltransferase